jgi:hypothetical protein
MDIITRFVNAGWDVNIHHTQGKTMEIVYITVSKGNLSLTAEGDNIVEAKKDLCLMNKAELGIGDMV